MTDAWIALLLSIVLGACVIVLLSPLVGSHWFVEPTRHGVAGELHRERVGVLDRLHRRLAFMQIGLGVPHYLWISGVSGCVAVFFTHQVLGSWWLSLPACVIGVAVCERLVRFLWMRRSRRFEEGNLRAMRIMASSLRTSPSYLHAFEQVAASRFVDPLVAQEYKRLAELLRSQVPLELALKDLQLRTGSSDIAHLSTIVQVQRELGGDMAKTLDLAAHAILRRRQFTRRQQAQLSSLLSQTNILSVMPFVFAAALWLNNPGHFDPLMESLAGRLAILGAFLSILAGGEIIRYLAVRAYRGSGVS